MAVPVMAFFALAEQQNIYFRVISYTNRIGIASFAIIDPLNRLTFL